MRVYIVSTQAYFIEATACSALLSASAIYATANAEIEYFKVTQNYFSVVTMDIL
jgi:hypothetical protein